MRGQSEAPKKVKKEGILDRTYFATCPECRRYKLKVKQQRDTGSLFIACTGYPQCRHVINLPKMVTHVMMLDTHCEGCLKVGQRVNLLKLDFDANFVNEDMSEVLPFEDNTSGHFCIMCDQQYH